MIACAFLLVNPAYAQTTRTAEPKVTIGGERLATRGLVVPSGVKPPPETKASAFVIADADTGEVLAAKDPHGLYRPASTLKILTAVTVLRSGLDKNMKVKPSVEACNVEGSAVGLKPQRIYTIDDLLKALLMVSGNDAAMALAEANGGLAATLRDMNAEARRLQALDTVAKTPNGLDKPGQRTSAYDLALISRAGLKNADFRRYVSTRLANFPAPKGKTYQIANHNKLLGRYKGMLGVKNGWTSKAQSSFVGAARRDGHTIIVSIMHHKGYFWDEVAALLDWGFAARGKVAAVGTLVPPAEAKPATGPRAAATPVVTASPAAAPAAPTDSGLAPYVIVVAVLAGVVWITAGLLRRRTRGRSRVAARRRR
ncbi:D-alanyl-D-alanine carboxypeptidase [Thermopolyspora sp. NPDC052614]|uniref:D-alanyl-D-alanine carboxypeptidase family protein n=1 Tax=Thermopolyspora sp. NPDC052614 TaxID=3155682 RepID=UPI003430A277